ncbi:rhomboid family intramembrane serine protease [Planctomycetota bacterium]
MGLYDREYSHGNYNPQHRAPQMRMKFPSLTPMVKRLLIINVAVFFLSIIIKPLGNVIYQWFCIDATSIPQALQLWRLVSYQFLHASFWHLLFNMIGLYFLGPTLERHWHSRKFLTFYLGCGIAGGLLYLTLVSLGLLDAGVMVGASGAILGMLAACAILFPHFVVFILFFPVPIRVAAIILTGWYVANLFTGAQNAGGDAAHLGGMAAGAIYVFSQNWQTKFKTKVRFQQFQKKVTSKQDIQQELDQILEKVHQSGIHSLSSKEKKILKQATKNQQTKNNN